MRDELPVFDRSTMLPVLVDTPTEWQPRRLRVSVPRVIIRLPNDGPDVEWRLDAQAARVASNSNSGQTSTYTEDWPLQKLLRTESNNHCLALAERYRGIHDLAAMPVELVGADPVDLYVVQNQADDGKNKGAKRLTGRMATVETFPRRGSAPIPRRWNGDWRILSSIDAKQELAILRGKLAYVSKILEAFEMAVVDGMTLEAIGKQLGGGSKGAKGEARARIFDGFEIVDRFWQQRDRKAA